MKLFTKRQVECSCKCLQNRGFISEAVPESLRVAELGPKWFILWVAFVCLYWEITASTSHPHHRELATREPPSLSNKGAVQEELHHQRGWDTKSQPNPGFLPTSLHLLGTFHFKCSAQARAPYPSVLLEAKYLLTSASWGCTQLTLSALQVPFHSSHISGKSSVKLQNMLTFLPCYSKKV